MSHSIRDYFSTKDDFPDSKGSLSSQLPSRAIALANKEVTRVLQENGNSLKCQCGKYTFGSLGRLNPAHSLTFYV